MRSFIYLRKLFCQKRNKFYENILIELRVRNGCKSSQKKALERASGTSAGDETLLEVLQRTNVGRIGKIEETSEGVCDRLLDMGELNTENSRRITQLEIGSHKVQAKGGIERQQGSSFLFS